MNTFQQGWAGHLLAAAAGALVTLSLAPFDIWPLGLVSAGLLCWLLQHSSPAQAALRGWCYGVGLFGAGTSWVYVSIHVYGYASVALASFLTLLFTLGLALFTALPCYLYARWVRNQAFGQTLGFAAVFVLGEWWRSWFLTGFPWLYLGYAHIDSPLAGWAPIGGVLALSFVVALSSAVLAQWLHNRRTNYYAVATLAALWIGGFALQQVTWVKPKGDHPVKVAMVQANISQAEKWRPEQYQATLALYEQMSQPLWQDYDLVVWPEAAIPGFHDRARGFLSDIAAQAREGNAGLITGIPFRHYEGEQLKRHNSIIALGRGSGTYHKQRLVPFGEYVPMEGLLRGLIQFFDLPMSNFNSGNPSQEGLTVNGYTLAPFICYEVVYPELVADWLPQADMLITISNDAWFGDSIGPLQHLQMAQMRALEAGRYMLRSTGSGVSAIIDHRGQILSRSGQFTQEVITGEAIPLQGATPFAVTGSWPVLILCLLLCISGRLFTAKMRR